MNSINEDFASTAFFKTAQDFISGIKSKKASKADTPNLGGSISRYTKNLVMTFPVLCDDSLPISTASMISKANERNIVSMFQMLFASMQLNGTDGEKILSSLHTNINFNSSLEDIADQLANWANESTVVSNAEINTAIREMVTVLKENPKRYPVSSFSETSLNDYTVLNVMGNTVVKEISNKTNFKTTYGFVDPSGHSDGEVVNKIADTNRKIQQFNQDAEMHPLKVAATNLQNVDIANNIIRKQLLDTDVKKANELQPTLLIVNYNEIDPANNNKIFAKSSFIAGIKSRLISVDSRDIIDRIAAKDKTKMNFINLIRALTGEISFTKDFLFAVNQNKLDAKNSVKKGSAAHMWKTLEHRSAKNYYNKVKKLGNDASAITSLAISQETVNAIKKEYNIDIENVNVARNILNDFNLLAIFICDESIEAVKSMYDGADNWEQNAYSSLERESNDNSYKKVINLIGKTNGR